MTDLNKDLNKAYDDMVNAVSNPDMTAEEVKELQEFYFKLRDEQELTNSDAANVDDESEFNAKVQEAIKSAQQEQRPDFIPIGVLNWSVGEDGKITKVAVLDKDGNPKEIESISIETDVTVQVFDPMNGDTLIEVLEGAEDAKIRSLDPEEEPKTLADCINPEFLDITVQFLHDLETRHFFIKDHNDKVKNMELNEAHDRRVHLANLLAGVASPTIDQLANWIDRTTKVDVAKVDWKDAMYLPDTKAKLMMDYKLDGTNSSLKSSVAIVWRNIADKPVAELLQINVNPGEILAGSKEGMFKVVRDVPMDDAVYKLMIISQEEDEVTDILLYSNDGTPVKAKPVNAITPMNKDFVAVVKYLDLESLYDVSSYVVINNPKFKFDRQFNLDMIAKEVGAEYQSTRFVNDDEVFTIDLTDEEDTQFLTPKFFSKPMAHIFTDDDKDRNFSFVTVVNIPESVLDVQATNKDGIHKAALMNKQYVGAGNNNLVDKTLESYRILGIENQYNEVWHNNPLYSTPSRVPVEKLADKNSLVYKRSIVNVEGVPVELDITDAEAIKSIEKDLFKLGAVHIFESEDGTAAGVCMVNAFDFKQHLGKLKGN